jgi:hypothetical protein
MALHSNNIFSVFPEKTEKMTELHHNSKFYGRKSFMKYANGVNKTFFCSMILWKTKVSSQASINNG